MSFDYVRKYYGIPAKRGGKIVVLDLHGNKTNRYGRIVSAPGAHIRVLLDGEKHPKIYHPETVEYI